MSKYYRMLPDYKSLCVEIDLHDDLGEINDDFDLEEGKPLENPPIAPVVFDFTIDEYDVLPGEVWSFPAYNTIGSTFDLKIIKQLQELGVDNLEIYPVTFVNTENGEMFHDVHAAVNIVGLVSCADDDLSRSKPLAGSRFYLDLKIDPACTKGLLIFRLAEQPMDIIVHEKIALAIQARSYKGIIFEDVT